MLRRKLLLILGSLVILLVIGAITAILLVDDVLDDLDRMSTESALSAAVAVASERSLTQVDSELMMLRRSPDRDAGALIAAVEALAIRIERPGGAAVDRAGGAARERVLGELLPALERDVRAIGEAHVAEIARIDRAQERTLAIREAIASDHRRAQTLLDEEQARIVSKFRGVALGLGLGHLLVINLSILVLLRAMTIVLRPVDELVEASRRLAREEFDYRLEVHRHDEFGELAVASNRLAEQLQSNEQRKMEMLQQVARMLNHELNNAIAIIELQLKLLARNVGDEKVHAERLHQIRQMLHRMTKTVSELKQVRRIVLTDYTSGVKMLDLERSIEPEPASEPAAGAARAERRPGARTASHTS